MRHWAWGQCRVCAALCLQGVKEDSGCLLWDGALLSWVGRNRSWRAVVVQRCGGTRAQGVAGRRVLEEAGSEGGKSQDRASFSSGAGDAPVSRGAGEGAEKWRAVIWG